ncbi:MAG: hypothetical protein ACRDOU_17380 [Streptosporangiaceae bacterium]
MTTLVGWCAVGGSRRGSTVREARQTLAELHATGLVSEPAPGRFGCHDLLRAYATGQGRSCDTRADRRAARDRMLDHFLHTAHTAMQLIDPAADPLPLPSPVPGVRPERLRTHTQAVTWFTAE